ncbi:cytotoxic translational repressor of toxin-antitoxin stability system [Pseudarthrobacter sp. AB1]|uniref:cytotoxic translational repressor of toxin-antitoxin stability system n=1 Tax=Pseudarthrobacter sp. AB1 TaxID=2138309 RepID=UPI00186B86D2|nr:cytotoxic translational repressor of toxin-antitoxin stability system [Pseudarthrobacter sp. AB1]MBE4719551.1 cytotoxic translational repressor of toxin-antitoxin stability system [Pseudarthrobacter sp. AB1]
MKYPPTTRRDHEQFCVTEKWERRKTATGKTGTHHHNYELALHDGRILITRISHPVDRSDYGPDLWGHILREQIEVDNAAFWDCVKNGVLPDRGRQTEAPPNAIPAGVVSILIGTFHLPEEEVKGMTATEAIARMGELFSKPAEDGDAEAVKV